MIDTNKINREINNINKQIEKMKCSIPFLIQPNTLQENNCNEYQFYMNRIFKKAVDYEYQSIEEYKNDFYYLFSKIINEYGEKSLFYMLFKKIIQKVERETQKIIMNIEKYFQKIDQLSKSIKILTENKSNYLNKFGQNLDFLNDIQIADIIASLVEKTITIKQIQKHFRCSHDYFKKFITNKNFEYPTLKPGNKKMEISEENINETIELQNCVKYGYQKAAEILQVSEWKSRLIFKLLNQKNKKEIKQRKIHDKRFHATKINVLWHTDIHYLKNKPPYLDKQYYLIAYIDDFSRKILYYEINDSKDMQFTARSLNNCILFTGQKPYYITTDNGREFTGKDFTDALNSFGIRQYNTEPYNPEENGKIERFWQNIEALSDYKDIPALILLYNYSWSQKVLKKYTNQKCTPEMAHNILPKFDWNNDINYPLKYFIVEEE